MIDSLEDDVLVGVYGPDYCVLLETLCKTPAYCNSITRENFQGWTVKNESQYDRFLDFLRILTMRTMAKKILENTLDPRTASR
jgi:hypothetical protein